MSTYDGPMDWPHWDRISDVPVFNTKAVVQQTGVPAPTLRAWERRYHLLSPERAQNTYRLYSERDVALIQWLQNRLREGMSISQAVQLFHHRVQESPLAALGMPTDEVSTEGPYGFDVDTSVPPTVPTSRTPGAALPALDGAGSGYRDQELHSYFSFHNLLSAREHLLHIFETLNEQAAHVTLGSISSLYSIEQICTELITPTMHLLGQRWAEGQLSASVEHFASTFFRALLSSRFHIAPSPLHGPLVIVVCGPREGHELGALMLALFLRLQQVRVVYLGQCVEPDGLLQTIRQLGPAMVCLSLTLPTFLPETLLLGQQIQQLPQHLRPLMIFGGQAFTNIDAASRKELPGRHLAGDLSEITARLCAMIKHQRKK